MYQKHKHQIIILQSCAMTTEEKTFFNYPVRVCNVLNMFYFVKQKLHYWWTNWHWDRYFTQYSGFTLSVSFQICSVLVHSSISDAI
jgi:hypothetical protein